jgi:tRNA pseudouridine13 synthase
VHLTVIEPVQLDCAHGPPPTGGRIRVEPEDFVVEERLGFEPDGVGGHVLLSVEKRGANTGWVAAQLARTAGVQARDVGYSGQKDRHAVTRQSYSLPWPVAAPLDACLAFAGEGYRVLSAARHGRKLRPGSHRGNRFAIRVRDVDADPGAIDGRLRVIADEGVPNYFGPQRFGREQGNLTRARVWAQDGAAPRDRVQRGFAMSAARSEIFNRVVGERVRRGDWNRLLPGEAVMLDGRRSFFAAPVIDALLEDRCRRMDVHPSGPMWGRGEPAATGVAREVEDAVLGREPGLARLLESERLEQERRSLRLPVRSLRWTHEAGGLRLEFELPRGTFATAVLHELLRDAWTLDTGGED